MKKIILISSLISACGGGSELPNEKVIDNQKVTEQSSPTKTETKEEVAIASENNTEEKVVVNKKETKEVDTGKVTKELKKLLASFVITSPSANTSSVVKTKTPTLTWSTSQLQAATLADAEVTYDVKVATNSSCTDPLQSHTTTANTQTLDSLQKGTYYVCVDAKSLDSVKSAGNSPYTLTVEPEEVKVLLTPQPFSITGPGQLVTRTTKVNLTWTASTNATLYEVRKSSSASCDGIMIGTTNETSLSVALTNLETAYFCVYAKNGDNVLVAGQPYKVEVNVESGLVSAQSLGLWNGTWTQGSYSFHIPNWNSLKSQGLKWTTATGKVMYTFGDVHAEEGTDRVRYYTKATTRNDEWVELVKNY